MGMVRGPLLAAAAACVAALLAACAATPPPPPQPTLPEVLNGSQRSAEHRARDRYRHPEETLEYFSLRPDMTVVEVWPGGAGWYSEILAPYLRASGTYYAAIYPDNWKGAPPYVKGDNQAFRAKLKADGITYGWARIAALGPPSSWNPAPAGSVDLVLTFRNVHNWMEGGYEREMFASFFRMLKPGGVLGVVEHRAAPYTTLEQMKKTGYVAQDLVVRYAEDAGLRFVGWEEFNANPLDSRDHPVGVWTLPPTLALGEQDRDRYLAIGESDRMTLRFVKPHPGAAPAP